MRKLLRKAGAILMVCAMLITLFPASAFAALTTSKSAEYKDGTVLKDDYGKTYQFDHKFLLEVRQYNNGGGYRTIILDNEDTTPKRSFVIKQNGTSYRGYCIEHGIRTGDSVKMKGTKDPSDVKSYYKGLKDHQKENIELALFYGWQSGRDINDKTYSDTGFRKSKWYQKTVGRYNNDDWYMATQMLIWEIQQGYRTSDMDYDKASGNTHKYLKYASGKPVSIYHYLQPLKGHGAYDIYQYMVDAMKMHGKMTAPLNATSKGKAKTVMLKQEKDADGNLTNIWSAEIVDKGKYPVTKGNLDNYRNLDKSLAEGLDKKKYEKSFDKLKITPSKNSKGKLTYKIVWKGTDPTDKPDDNLVVKLNRIYGSKKAEKNTRIFWFWKDSGTYWYDHCQPIATGAADPISFYFKVDGKITDKPVTPDDKPEPEYFPEFEFPVSKEDLNPGWDGDKHTGMGDASLGATYVLYRDGVEIDRITLNDNGETESFTDKPWEDVTDFTETESGFRNHYVTEGDPPKPVLHCTVTPTHIEWNASVTYEIREIRPDGRFIEPDSGVRTYKINYHAESDDLRECTSSPNEWTDIEYNVTANIGTDNTTSGTIDEVEEEVTFDEQVYINDCYRGKITLTKSLEDENIFDDKPTAGGKTKSTKSYWKLYLKNGYEPTKYIRFNREADLADGTAVYRATRDTSGTDNAISEMKIGSNGSMLILDVPYGEYYMEETTADNTSFVREKFTVVIDEHNGTYSADERYDNRYDYDIRDKKKENKIQIVKTDAETGKKVSVAAGTKFRIRYMGNQLLGDPTKSKNYGKLLPNAPSITDKTGYNDEFVCDENGCITIPYMLKFGTYRLEEFRVPEGYFIGKYDKDGNPSNADYGIRGDYGKDDDGKTTIDWGNPALDDSTLVPIYTDDGKHVEYKEKADIFNYYTFRVSEQALHEDGNFGQMVDYQGNITAADAGYDNEDFPYEVYYKTVAMPNNQVKGKIEIYKEGEEFSGWEKVILAGEEVFRPVFSGIKKLGKAVFGIFAAEDIILGDGNDGPEIYDSISGEKLSMTKTKSTNSGAVAEMVEALLGKTYSGNVYETGNLDHNSGAKLWYMLERAVSEGNVKRTMYVTPEQKDTTYRYTYETEDTDNTYRYDVEVTMSYKAGGKNVTDVSVFKTTISKSKGVPAIGTSTYKTDKDGNLVKEAVGKTLPKQYVGTDTDGNPVEVPLGSYGNFTEGNLLDETYHSYVFEADGKKTEDWNGDITDFSKGAAKRYEKTDYTFAKFTPEEVREAVIVAGVDIDGDGKYDKPGETPPVMGRPDFPVLPDEYHYKGTIEAYNTVIVEKEITEGSGTKKIYKVRVFDPENSAKTIWIDCDDKGAALPDYTIEDGYTEMEYSNFVMEFKEVDGKKQYKVLLADKTWLDCDEYGNFETALVEHYQLRYTQQSDNEDGFKFAWDGFDISSKATFDKKATTTITRQGGTPVIDTGVGMTYAENGNTTTFVATEPYAPVYFKSRDGIKTEMYYFGGTQRTLITVPASAVDNLFGKSVPTLRFTSVDAEGGSRYVYLDWFKDLGYDKQTITFEPCSGVNVTAKYHGGSADDLYYTIEIISDKGEDEAVEITYSDGYKGKFYCSTAASGNGVGVIELDSIYKTSRYSTSDLVEVITTDENGLATSKELPLGKYIVRELSAPDGYITNPEGREVELKYKDQFTPLVWGKTVVRNEAVSVEIDLEKVFETAYESGVFYPSDGAKFGVYTNEKISAMNPVGSLKKSAEKGTLVNVFEVDEKGKSTSKVKLPEGTYYIKEIATKAGYVLNDTPFYFKVSESKEVTSTPVDFNYAADGVSGDIVMDSYGVAIVNIDSLTRYPMPTFTLNGKIYKLNESYTDDNVSVTVEKDRARATVIVGNGKTADITLPNGVPVKVAVDGNVYNYSINGVSDTYIPTVSYTGYKADFSREFVPMTKTDFSAETEDITFKGTGDGVLKATVTHTPVTYVETVKPGIDLDGDGLYDKPGETAPVTKTKGKLDAKGKQIYTHIAKFRVEDAAGNSIINYIARNGIEETISDPVSMADGDKIIVKDSENTQFSVQLSEGNIYFSANSIISGAITDINKPAATVNGVPANDKLKLYRNVTLARQDHKANTIQIKANSERIDVVPVENNADKPIIRTLAFEKNSKAHTASTGNVTITDRVSYTKLVPNTYTLTGIVMDKATGEPLLAGGRPVTATKTFTNTEVEGFVEMDFNFDASNLKGKSVVIFETLSHENREIAEHKDITDVNQTVTFIERPYTPPAPPAPSIKTTAVDSETKDHISYADKKVTIIDTVSYKNLTAGKEYTVTGTLVDKATGLPILSDGREVTATKTFIPEKAGGTVDMEFTFNGSALAGKTVVAFEGLQYNGIEVAAHRDLKDESQTVYFPEIGTSARDKETNLGISNADKSVTVIDTVTYKNLIAGKEYKMTGVLMDKATGKPLKADGKQITAEKTFIPDKPDGTVEMEFTFDGSKFAGKSVVVFEKLLFAEATVATHEDINDKSQTVDFPKIGTTAKDRKTGTDTMKPDEKTVIIDTVKYEKLIPGIEYTMSGILMDKDTGKPLLVKGKTVTAEKKFTPKKSSGTVDMMFALDSSALNGKTVVVFEELTYDEKEIAVHKDLKDKKQTVYIIKDTPKDKQPKTGDTSGLALWGALFAAFAAAFVFSARRLRKMRK